VVHPPESWAEAWVAGVVGSQVRIVTTLENEYPFLSHVEESGGSVSFGASGELVVSQQGSPLRP
jgi:hypothetical protein